MSSDAGRPRAALPLSVRAYDGVRRGRTRLRGMADAVVDGCFLGLMDRDDLAVVDRGFYAAVRESVAGGAHRYSDPEHIRSGLSSWEAAAVDACFPAGGRVIVTAAGAGRELLGLLARGFDATGFEPNEQLVAAGAALLAAEGRAGRLLVSRRDEFPAAAPASADAVVVGWGSYMLIAGRRRRVAFLREARARLAPGAPLLVSFFERAPLRYFDVVRGIAAPLRRLRRSEPVELGDALTPNFAHYFTREEVSAELAEGGFEVARYRSAPYAHAVAVAV